MNPINKILGRDISKNMELTSKFNKIGQMFCRHCNKWVDYYMDNYSGSVRCNECRQVLESLDVGKNRKITLLHQQLKTLSKQKHGYYARKMLKEYEQVKKKYGVQEAESQIRYNYSDFFGR